MLSVQAFKHRINRVPNEKTSLSRCTGYLSQDCRVTIHFPPTIPTIPTLLSLWSLRLCSVLGMHRGEGALHSTPRPPAAAAAAVPAGQEAHDDAAEGDDAADDGLQDAADAADDGHDAVANRGEGGPDLRWGLCVSALRRVQRYVMNELREGKFKKVVCPVPGS